MEAFKASNSGVWAGFQGSLFWNHPLRSANAAYWAADRQMDMGE